MITRKELIKKYIDFFISKGHKEIPNVSLIPQNDPTVLFNTAGMQPLVPYLLGQKHPLGKRLVNNQKCIRTVDIDEVGDTYHHTFFEMLGNWSLGDYFKEETIEMSYEFLTQVLSLPKERLAFTCFKGSDVSPKDTESADVWLSLGVPKERIAFLEKDNFWGPAGKTGPCGPTTEMFYWKSNDVPAPKVFDPKDERWVEIWNDVFMEFNKNEKGEYIPLEQKNVDTGMGLDRTLAVLNGFDDNYLAENWKQIMRRIEKILPERFPSLKEDLPNYNASNQSRKKSMRIIADHVKAAVFIIADGVKPGNSEQGYVLRRLIRRAIRYGRLLRIKKEFISNVAESIFEIYNDYDKLKRNKNEIITTLNEEEKKFERTLNNGLRHVQKIRNELMHKALKEVPKKELFLLYQSYGFPLEMIKEEFDRWDLKIDEGSFNEELRKHQELSRTAAQGKFSSGLADSSEKTTALHTATHLLNETLRQVLHDPNIKQKGSNITPERLRFDFNFDRKLTDEEKKAIEDYVNDKIKQGLPVIREETSLKEALDEGAQAEFGAKYPEQVSVYTIKDETNEKGWISKEICTGPHVKNTKEMGTFKIKKEESASAGVRRIKAVLK